MASLQISLTDYNQTVGESWPGLSEGPLTPMCPIVMAIGPGTQVTYHYSIQDGFQSATDGSVLRVAQGVYGDSLILDKGKNLRVEGGWNSAFSTKESQSTLVGTLIISTGTVIVDSLVLK